jgi:hypothetical protein
MCVCSPTLRPGVPVEEVVRTWTERASRVVLGRVVGVDTIALPLLGGGSTRVASALAARVAVSRVWKGPRSDTLTVVFGTPGVMLGCNVDLEAGKVYVIFAARDAADVLRTRQCSGTAIESDAMPTIAALGPGEEPKE